MCNTPFGVWSRVCYWTPAQFSKLFSRGGGLGLKTISDSRNKDVALRRIKRLASSGLPLEPYVIALFELMNDAIPSAALKAFYTSSNRANAWICNSSELYKALLSAHRTYFE